MRFGIGVADIPVKIVGVSRWRSVSDVARHYQVGRSFIAGDAAHVMPPNGGFGGNTGIHDGHNLAWKLAYPQGTGRAPRLTTYETERRPVGKFTVEQAYSRYVTRSAQYLGAKDYEPVNDFDIEIGYLYKSPAIVPEDDMRWSMPIRANVWRAGSRATHFGSSRKASASRRSTFSAVASRCWPRRKAKPGARRRVKQERPGLALDAYTFGQSFAIQKTVSQPLTALRPRAQCLSAPTALLPGARNRPKPSRRKN